MSITDELREIAAKTECANGRCEKLYRGDLDHTADCIDERIECEYVKLPMDADGVPYRIGDKVDGDHYEDGTVTGIQFYEMTNGGIPNGGIRTLIAVRPDGWDVATWHTPDEYRHHKQPTVEDVLRDMHAKLDEVTALYVGEAIDSDERDSDEARIFAEFAAKLRLAGDAE